MFPLRKIFFSQLRWFLIFIFLLLLKLYLFVSFGFFFLFWRFLRKVLWDFLSLKSFWSRFFWNLAKQHFFFFDVLNNNFSSFFSLFPVSNCMPLLQFYFILFLSLFFFPFISKITLRRSLESWLFVLAFLYIFSILYHLIHLFCILDY